MRALLAVSSGGIRDDDDNNRDKSNPHPPAHVFAHLLCVLERTLQRAGLLKKIK